MNASDDKSKADSQPKEQQSKKQEAEVVIPKVRPTTTDYSESGRNVRTYVTPIRKEE